MGIVQCHGDGFMAQKLFDGLKINPGHAQPGGNGMAEIVEVEVLYPSLCHRFSKGLIEPVKWLSPVSGEYTRC